MKYLVVFIFLSGLFFQAFPQHKPENQLMHAVQTYLHVWNGGSVDSLNSITSDNFQIRINPTFEAKNGRDKLKEEIANTRLPFPDFSVKEKEMIILSDTAMVITWVISGTFKNPQDSTKFSKKTEANGFSVIFFHDNILTGEWIAYSDLTWYKNLGYDLVMSGKK